MGVWSGFVACETRDLIRCILESMGLRVDINKDIVSVSCVSADVASAAIEAIKTSPLHIDKIGNILYYVSQNQDGTLKLQIKVRGHSLAFSDEEVERYYQDLIPKLLMQNYKIRLKEASNQ